MYITITRSNNYLGIESYIIGQELVLVKDKDNRYDDESILVKTTTDAKCGYVANSVNSVARGTHSAGYIYNMIKDDQKCLVSFIVEDKVIAEII